MELNPACTIKKVLRFTRQTSSGFTLIELLVVIAIIGLLASITLVSLSSARSKARDARRMSDFHAIQLALELYYDAYGSYVVAGTGYQDYGIGWLSYEDGVDYYVSVTRGLWEEGFLNADLVEDPIQSPGYMIFVCNNENGYSLSATLENPRPENIDLIQHSCNGTGVNGTYTVYGKNYAIGNEYY